MTFPLVFKFVFQNEVNSEGFGIQQWSGLKLWFILRPSTQRRHLLCFYGSSRCQIIQSSDNWEATYLRGYLWAERITYSHRSRIVTFVADFYRYSKVNNDSGRTEMMKSDTFVCFLSVALVIIRQIFACNIASTAPSVHGLYCVDYNIRNTSHITRHECTLECMRSQTCYVISYSNVHNYCLVGDHPCSEVRRNDDFEMQIMKDEKVENCVQWTDDQTAFQPNRVQYGSRSRPMAVIRVVEGGNILPGKWHQSSSVAHAALTKAIRSDKWQVLLISKGCSTSWLPYNPLSEPLPTSVILGGHLEDGTPLYVARRLYGSLYVSGFYNPQTQLIHTESSGYSHTYNVLQILTVAWT